MSQTRHNMVLAHQFRRLIEVPEIVFVLLSQTWSVYRKMLLYNSRHTQMRNTDNHRTTMDYIAAMISEQLLRKPVKVYSIVCLQ